MRRCAWVALKLLLRRGIRLGAGSTGLSALNLRLLGATLVTRGEVSRRRSQAFYTSSRRLRFGSPDPLLARWRGLNSG
jgi:hypothetical protein